MDLPDLSPQSGLFLDVDGTLLEFAPAPDAVQVPRELPPLLEKLHGQLNGALALVSGRPIATIDRLFHPARLPAAGQHGAEWRLRADGEIMAPSPPPGREALRRGLESFVRGVPEAFLEEKPYSISLHYRGAGGDLRARLVDLLAREGLTGWQILEAHRAFEIKRPEVDKGRAISRFLHEAPFLGRVPVFLGDDRTDEDGFAAIREAGGIAVRVGPEARESSAAFRLAGPAETRAWLADQAEVLEPAVAAARSSARLP